VIPKALWTGIVLVVIGCLGLVGLNIYESMAIAPDVVQERQLVIHAYDVIQNARGIEAALSAAERGQRGYIITGEPIYLANYKAGVNRAPQLFEQLRELTRGNPEQQRRMPVLQAEMNRRIALLKQTLDVREREGFEPARRLVESDLGLDTMRAVTSLIDQISNGENALLQQRLTDLSRTQQVLTSAAETELGLTLLVMTAGATLIWLAWRERERGRKDLEQTRTMLAQAQKMETLGQLAGGIAHDFNNMLAVIRGGTQMLRRRLIAKDPEIARIVEHIDQGTDRAAGLTARLLAFSRRRPVIPEMIDVNAIIAGLADILRYTLGGDIEVETTLAPDLWPIFVDRNQLENAILNLAVNARDAMPDGGRLTIETQNISVDGKKVVAIFVRDTGRGMTPEVLQRALEPFFTTKGEGRGTGLGLAQVQALARQSDGAVEIDSAPGAGTTVTLRFPALS
jgi:signal transduction histidine kinase